MRKKTCGSGVEMEEDSRIIKTCILSLWLYREELFGVTVLTEL